MVIIPQRRLVMSSSEMPSHYTDMTLNKSMYPNLIKKITRLIFNHIRVTNILLHHKAHVYELQSNNSLAYDSENSQMTVTVLIHCPVISL